MKRRNFLIGAAAGAAGVAGAVHAAGRNGLIAPDTAGLLGAGEMLTYAAHRVLGENARAREFKRSEISAKPFANELQPPPSAEHLAMKANGFAEWPLVVEGLVEKPLTLSMAELKAMPVRSHITQLACEEGWSYVAEWTGTPLSEVLRAAGVKPEARYVVYTSAYRAWWDSIDMAEANHPQTLVAHGMNGAALPVEFGGPLRMRVPRQLGYKNVKFINKIEITDDLKKFGKGLGSSAPEGGYAWYAGI